VQVVGVATSEVRDLRVVRVRGARGEEAAHVLPDVLRDRNPGQRRLKEREVAVAELRT
jgi:hypothetical protein